MIDPAEEARRRLGGLIPACPYCRGKGLPDDGGVVLHYVGPLNLNYRCLRCKTIWSFDLRGKP